MQPPAERRIVVHFETATMPDWRVEIAEGRFQVARELRVADGCPVALALVSDQPGLFTIPALAVRMSLMPGRTRVIRLEGPKVGTYEVTVQTSTAVSRGKFLVGPTEQAANDGDDELHRASIAELVQMWVQVPANDRESADRVRRELDSRPGADVAVELARIAGTTDPKTPGTIALLLRELLAAAADDRLPAEARDAVGRALHVLHDVADEKVRASTLFWLGHGWVRTPPDNVPDVYREMLRELLGSSDSEVRFQAAIAASWLGPAVDALAPSMTVRLASDSDSGVRFALANALGRIGAGHPPAAEALVAALTDRGENVRYASAQSLGNLPNTANGAIAALHARLADPAEADLVRQAAAESLALLVAAPADAEAVLRDMLALRSLFPVWHQTSWFVALGRLAAKAPGTDAANKARLRLTEAAEGEDEDVALVATSSLARIACAERDAGLGRMTAERLVALVPQILEAVTDDPDGWNLDATRRPLLEAVVALAAWPELQIDAEPLRRVLECLQKSGPCWTRAWAGEQLRLLR